MNIINNRQDVEKLRENHCSSDKTPYDWQCGRCHTIHHETEIRNLLRRKNPCPCYSSNVSTVKQKLLEKGWLLVEYRLNKNYNINREDLYTKVRCIKCGREKHGYWINFTLGKTKCDCDTTKKIKNIVSIKDFYDKWPNHNKKHFELISTKYNGRNSKYIVKCKHCGRTDKRWGISLLDNSIKCKYCSEASIGEQKIIDILEDKSITYYFQYPVKIKNHTLFFDFYIPQYNCAIEFDGLQHFEPCEYFGGQKRFEKQQRYDAYKNEYCEDNNMALIRIKYSDNDDTIYDKISQIFND
jgi:hypothetical protein